MPLRVRCRCGQELTLRYSEWVYIFLVITLLALLANTTAVVLLIMNFREMKGTVSPSVSPSDRDKARPVVAKDEVPNEAETPAKFDDPRPSVSSASFTAGAEQLPAVEVELTEGGVSLFSSPRPAVESLLEQLELLPHASRSLNEPDGSGPPTETLYDGPKLIRLLLLKESRRDLGTTCAYMIDPDPLIRVAAMEQLLVEGESLGQDAENRRLLTPIVAGARDYLRRERPGRRILELFELTEDGDGDANAAERQPEKHHWSAARERVEKRAADLPGHAQFERQLALIEKQGADFLFVLDTTRSMDRPLAHFKKAAAWLVRALEWGVPETRVGLLLYKDEVDAIVGLSPQPSKDLLPHVLSVEASGGGDVPEGVYTALRTSLELGKIAWRPRAVKHVVIIADQPSRYAEKQAFESLAAASHRQGGFFIHLLGVGSPSTGAKIPFFADFARCGGGRYSSCTNSAQLGEEALVCLFGNDHRRLLKRLPRLLRYLFLNEVNEESEVREVSDK